MTETGSLEKRIERLWAEASAPDSGEIANVVGALRDALQSGSARAAEVRDGQWHVNAWVKRGILLGFRAGRIREYPAPHASCFDKDTMPTRAFSLQDGVRIVPGGSSIREGAYVAPGVVCMPPTYVNIGAYIDEGTMLDSHVLVGSCAHIGKRVHLSAGVQIGGVLEPPGAIPVVIEDDVFVGGQSGVYEGARVCEGAVLAPGVLLTRATTVYDLVREQILRASETQPLTIPPGAVVVPGSRPASGAFASEHGLQLYAPVIVKYRDAGTDAAVVLEQSLREGTEGA
jgi:2,3,4,5-tetrahydropyridine-2-carboxylate N-succinyltransferase